MRRYNERTRWDGKVEWISETEDINKSGLLGKIYSIENRKKRMGSKDGDEQVELGTTWA